MAPGLGVIDRDDIGSLAGGILDILQQKVERTRIRSQSLTNNDDTVDSIPMTANRSASFDKTDKPPIRNTPGHDATDTIVHKEDDQPSRTRPLHLIGKPTLRKHLLDPNSRSLGSTTPNSISRTSSRDLMEEMSDTGSLIQAIMDDIGKVKSDVEAAQALLANSRSYEELMETLSIQDGNPFEDDSIGSNFTFEGGQSVSSRFSLHSYSKRVAMRKEGSLVLPKKKGISDTPGLPKPATRPPVILQFPKPPKKKIMNQETTLDVNVDDNINNNNNNNHEIGIFADEQKSLKQAEQDKVVVESNNNSNLDLFLTLLSHSPSVESIEMEASPNEPPSIHRSQSHDPDIVRIESNQATHGIPPSSIRVQSPDPDTVRVQKILSHIPTLKHIPQRGTVSKVTRGVPDRIEVVQQKPPSDREILPCRSSPLHSTVVKKQQTPSELVQSQSVPARQKQDHLHPPERTGHSSPPTPNLQHHYTHSKQARDRKESRQKQTQLTSTDQVARDKAVTPPSQKLPDNITYQRSTRSTKSGDSSVRRSNEKSHRLREEGLHSSPRSSAMCKLAVVAFMAPPMQMEGAIGEETRRESTFHPRQIRSEPEKRRTVAKNVSEELKRCEVRRRTEGKVPDEMRRPNEKTRPKLKAQDEKTRPIDEKLPRGIRLSDKFNVQEMRLPHEIGRENTDKWHDEYSHRSRKEHVGSHHTVGKQGQNHQEGVRHSISMAEHEMSMKHRYDRTFKGDRAARNALSGNNEALITTKYKDGIPTIIKFDTAKSGRSVSPYEEKDDLEIDRNELTTRLPDFGHFTLRDAKIPSRAGPRLR